MVSPSVGRTGTQDVRPEGSQQRLQRRALELRAVSPAVWAGALALLAAIALTITVQPTMLSVALGVVAVVGLSREPRLGVLPAALLALIAIPYGRAADNDLAELAGIPLRFQDGVVVAAGLLALPALRHVTWRTGISRLIGLFLLVGVGAVVIGLVEGNPWRDVLRDVRWWALYGFGLLALWGGVDRRAVVRGLLLGATVYATVLLLVTVLPAFAGGLESRALTYDWGRVRLQFSNSIFLIPAMAYVATRLTFRPNSRDAAWLGLLSVAIVLSITRMSIVFGIGTVGLAFVWATWRYRNALGLGDVVIRGTLVVATLVVATVVAVGAILVGSSVNVAFTPQGPGGPTDATGDVMGRILFQDPNSSVTAIEAGRFVTYRSAVSVIRQAPIIGSGLGTLVPIDFTFGGSRPN